ncbi:uncharacterized protein F4812DRAFT_409415 [Daldinia caldariorum]|uniref:uncharacterized protein n=1 Tax=Daldinia caldariorum TaxID=326644 RepID=UPI00200754F1|nr:uncharacterized protein F4812DRAFT_409415 [Daldinia caldariorum]KAI1472560.1 hypothetical protein F4812DRAFT_409415 [Daldinia caldariorum]
MQSLLVSYLLSELLLFNSSISSVKFVYSLILTFTIGITFYLRTVSKFRHQSIWNSHCLNNHHFENCRFHDVQRYHIILSFN